MSQRKLRICIVPVLLALLLSSAHAESFVLPDTLEEKYQYSFDLDGDGLPERIIWETDRYVCHFSIRNSLDETDELEIDPECYNNLSVYPMDIGGVICLMLEKDGENDQDTTWCLRYGEGKLYTMLFPTPYPDKQGRCTYSDCANGHVIAHNGSILTIEETIFFLGTYSAAREYRLTPWGRFELTDGIYRHQRQFREDGSYDFEHAPKLLVDLPYHPLAEDECTTIKILETGTRLLLTGTDCFSRVTFISEDGRAGWFPIYLNPFGDVSIDGKKQQEVFSGLPYAG